MQYINSSRYKKVDMKEVERGGSVMKAKVNDGCISCGACVAAYPEVFRFNDEDVAEAYAEVTEDVRETAEEARDGCPVSVIDLLES